VVLNRAGQSGRIGDARDPRRELRVPDKRMPTDKLAVGLRPINDRIEAGKRKPVLAGLNRFPLYQTQYLGLNLGTNAEIQQ
jgi:hypothetical protein